jgi:TRAP-type mannitol/chloroaromatic compound transport system permease large subunit
MTRWYRRGAALGFFFQVGVRRRPTGWLAYVVTPFAALLAVWVITAATVIIVAPWTLAVTVLSAMMTLAFLGVGARARSDPERPSPIDWLLSAAALACGVYFTIHAGAIEQRVVLLDPLSTADIVFAAILFVLTLEITRRTTGMGLTLVVLLFVAYNLLGHRLDGVLKHGYIDLLHFLEITVFTTDGILGLPVRVAATYAFLFVLFGTVLLQARGGDFFFDLAAALAGRRPGGPAKIAVVSSGVYGMVSGSPTSDVVTTGSITIPIMKRLGYQGRLAAAVEVAASTGGSLAPPVMGAAAFIMAEYTGIDYAAIAVAALIPALLYYLSVYAQVHFRSLKLGLQPLEPELIPRLTPTLKSGGLFLVPLIVITVALLMGYTPTSVAVYGSIAVLAVAALRKHTRVGPVGLYKALAETAFRMIPVAGACAAAGLVIAGITMTGLASAYRCCSPHHRARPRHADAVGLHPGGDADGPADGPARGADARRAHVPALLRGHVGDHPARCGGRLRGLVDRRGQPARHRRSRGQVRARRLRRPHRLRLPARPAARRHLGPDPRLRRHRRRRAPRAGARRRGPLARADPGLVAPGARRRRLGAPVVALGSHRRGGGCHRGAVGAAGQRHAHPPRHDTAVADVSAKCA